MSDEKPDSAPAKAGKAPPQVESQQRLPAGVMMEMVLDKLKLLDYEKELVNELKFRPLAKTSFAVPGQNINEQFFYFVSLIAFLFRKIGEDYENPTAQDDPNGVTADIIRTLMSLKVKTELTPPKLKQASGDAAVLLLSDLCDMAMERTAFEILDPEHPTEETPDEDEEGEEDDLGDEEIAAEVDEDEEEEYYMGGGPIAAAAVPAPVEPEESTEIIVSSIDPTEWKIEVERVAPQLKIKADPDNRDWRSHLTTTREYIDMISKKFPEAKAPLEKINADVGKVLDSILTREKYINNQYEHHCQEYRSSVEKLTDAEERYNACNETVTNLGNELATIAEDLDSLKSQMEDHGSSVTDTAPLVKIRKAIQKLKTEVKAMELRIGVVEHALLQTKVASRQQAVVVAEDDEEDSEDVDY
uniref:Intraflagellar transport protein 57 n=1 Tax=Palpitomonas bilix TaxID=652834 RepID=A0A7S3G348_9EUKA|mmetsp:Transcript_18244/g.45630  ORF Transcript_18244/g.45630 Transcript_18244/m.45630 type:complete len:415 (+) Transcript_18244:132-1376(+)